MWPAVWLSPVQGMPLVAARPGVAGGAAARRRGEQTPNGRGAPQRSEPRPYSGGDGGNRTRVQRVRPATCYRLSPVFVSHPAGPTGQGPAEPVDASLADGIDVAPTASRLVRRPFSRSRAKRRGGRDRLCRSGGYVGRLRGHRVCRSISVVGTYLVPLIYEGEAPRPAVADQPSLSKPVIPNSSLLYQPLPRHASLIRRGQGRLWRRTC